MTAGVLPIRLTTLRPMRDGAIIACLVLAGAHALGLINTGVDAHAYWAAIPSTRTAARGRPSRTRTSTPPVRPDPGTAPSPAVAGVHRPLDARPRRGVLWQSGCGWASHLPRSRVRRSTVGNIHLLLGAVIVAGFRWPWLWALPLLTKVTPGVGLLWFALRREWRTWPSPSARPRRSPRLVRAGPEPLVPLDRGPDGGREGAGLGLHRAGATVGAGDRRGRARRVGGADRIGAGPSRWPRCWPCRSCG